RGRLELVARDVGRRWPRTLYGLLRHQTRSGGVHICPADIRAGHARRLRPWVRTADTNRPVVGLLGGLPGRADLDLIEGKAALAGLGAEAVRMAVVEVEPAEI